MTPPINATTGKPVVNPHSDVKVPRDLNPVADDKQSDTSHDIYANMAKGANYAAERFDDDRTDEEAAEIEEGDETPNEERFHEVNPKDDID